MAETHETPIPPSGWTRMIEQNPGHSQWYIDRFDAMAASGKDLVGEARFIDALAPRGARILDAGCGPGRHGGWLAERGHQVVGVDGDPILIATAQERHPEVRWVVQDLAVLDLPDEEPFDVIYAVGNVMTFLHPDTRDQVLAHMARHLKAGGRLVTGHQPARGWAKDDLCAQMEAAGLVVDYVFGTWEMRPYTDASDFVIVVAAKPEGNLQALW